MGLPWSCVPGLVPATPGLQILRDEPAGVLLVHPNGERRAERVDVALDARPHGDLLDRVEDHLG